MAKSEKQTDKNQESSQFKSSQILSADGLKTLISSLALVVSVFALAKSCRVDSENIKQWNEINLARISVIDADYVTFRTISFEEFDNKEWGFRAQGLNNSGADNYDPNMVSIKFLVVANDTISKSIVPNTSAITVNELKNQLKKWGYTDTDRYVYEERYQPIITIQNAGKTACLIDSIVEEGFSVDSGNYVNAGVAGERTLEQKNFTIEPTQKFKSATFVFDVPLGAPTPSIMFNYHIYFQTVDQIQKVASFRIRSNEGDFLIRNLD